MFSNLAWSHESFINSATISIVTTVMELEFRSECFNPGKREAKFLTFDVMNELKAYKNLTTT